MAAPPTEGGEHRRDRLGSIALISASQSEMSSLRFRFFFSPSLPTTPRLTTYRRIGRRVEVREGGEVGCSGH